MVEGYDPFFLSFLLFFFCFSSFSKFLSCFLFLVLFLVLFSSRSPYFSSSFLSLPSSTSLTWKQKKDKQEGTNKKKRTEEKEGKEK